MSARSWAWLAVVVVVALFGSNAWARTVKIVQASRLEFRNVTLPDGAIEEYIIITGKPAVVLIDNDEVSGDRLEYNKTRRKLRVVGAGSFKSKTETVAGRDFDVDLETQGLQGEDVFIATQEIDIVGLACQRLPGQLEVQDGYFSPCARCGTATDAYGFRAAEITLYPGDRLIARGVSVLVGGTPVAYLPILVLFLGDPARQPRLDISQTTTEGITVDADLPFTVSDFGQGFTLLRYFEQRTPSFGFGVDLNLFDLFGSSNRTRAFFLALPPPPGSNVGAQFAYALNATGTIGLQGVVDQEDEFPPLRYELNINRRDAAITRTTDLRGVSGDDKRTNFSALFSLETASYTVQLETRGFWDHRDQPQDGDALGLANYNAGLPRTTQYLPEVRFTAGDPLLPRFGVIGFTAWGVSLGYITAPFDPLNASARRLAGDGVYVSAGKFSANWALGLDASPWTGARVNASANFRGQYYTTRNPNPGDPTQPGEFERNIVFALNANASQTLFGNAVTFTAAYVYTISEGESPFAFDRVSVRRPNSSLNLGLTAAPFQWASVNLSQRLEFTRAQNPADPLTFNLSLTPAPLTANFSASYDWRTMQPVGYSVSIGNTVPSGVSFSAATGFRFLDPFNPNFVPVWDDFRFTVGFRSPDRGRFSASLSLVQNPNNGEIRNWTVNGTWILGSEQFPTTLSFNQTLTPPQYSNLLPSPPQAYARLSGGFNLRLQFPKAPGENDDPLSATSSDRAVYTLDFRNDLDFTPYTFSDATPLPRSRIGVTVTGSEPLPWSLNFSSLLDLGTLEFFQPTLSGSVSSRTETQGGQAEFNLSFQLLLPWRNQSDWRFSSLSLRAAYDVFPGLSVFASLTYSRTLQAGVFRDRFTLDPVGFALALATEGSARPSIYFAMFLRGTYEFADDGRELPLFTPPATSTSSATPFPSTLRPIFTITFDACCYSLLFTFDTTPSAGVNFSFSIVLPFGKQDLITDTPNGGVRFPLLPFIPTIPRSPTP
jgi:hypothetical protein